MSSAPLSLEESSSILAQISEGARVRDIAAKLNVPRSTLNYWLVKDRESDWKEAQIMRALHRRDEADELMDTADNVLDLARAREKRKAAQWDLEKLFRRLFGADPAVAIQINEYTARPTEQLVDELRALLKK